MSPEVKHVTQHQIKMYGKPLLKDGQKFLPNPATFVLTPDTYAFTADDGTILYEFSQQRILIEETGNTTKYTLNWIATSKGWSATSKFGDGPPDIFIEFQNALGADVDTWDVGTPDLPCVQGNPMVFTNTNGMPNILDNNTSLNPVLTFRAPSDFSRCR